MASVSNFLVCASTTNELAAFFPNLDSSADFHDAMAAGYAVPLVTGVGIPLALSSVLLKLKSINIGWILNIGIAGGYPNSGLAVGDVVAGTSEIYGDVGFEISAAPGFQTFTDQPWAKWYAEPIELAPPLIGHLRLKRGCTVSCCTGTLATGLHREAVFAAGFETMEGAAVAHAGLLMGIPVTEIRAISNIAADRDMQPMNVECALKALSAFLDEFKAGF